MAESRELAFSIKILGKEGELSKLADVEKALAKTREQRALLNKAYKEGALSEDELAQSTAELNVTTKLLGKEKQDLTRTIELETQRANNQVGTYKALDATLQLLKREYKALSVEERKSASGQELLGKIQATDKTMKDFDASIGQNQRNVGDYTRALSGMGGVFGELGGKLSEGLESLNKIKTAILSSTVATNAESAATTSAGKAKLIFNKILKASPIFLLIGVLTSLIAYFTKSQKGIEQMGKAFAAVGAVVNVFIDRLIKVGGAIVNILSGNFQEGIDGITGSFKGMGDEMAREAQLAIRLKEQLYAVARAENDLILARAASRAEIKELDKVADDTTKSLATRSNAARKAIKIEQDLVAKTIQTQKDKAAGLLGLEELTNKKLEEIRKNGLKLEEVGLSESTEEDRKAAIEEIARIFELQMESTELQLTLNNKLNAINAEAVAKFKAAEAEKQKLREAELKQIESNNKEILDLAKQLRDGEAESLQEGRDKSVEILDNKYADERAALESQITSDKELLTLSKTQAAQRVQINELIYERIEQLRVQHRSDLVTIDKKAGEAEIEEQKKLNDLKLSEIDNFEKLEQLKIREQVITKSITQEQGEQALNDIRAKGIEDRLKLIDTETAEGKIKYQELINELAQITTPSEKSVLAELLSITDDEAEQLKSTALNLANEIANTIANVGAINRQNELNEDLRLNEEKKNATLATLAEELKTGVISQEQFEARKIELEQATEARKIQIEKEAFERNKKASKAAAAIAGALAIVNVLATNKGGAISRLIEIGAVVASTALQIATISAQKFALGGRVLGRVGASNIATQPNGDSVLATLKPNEVVLTERQQALLGGDSTFAALGVRGFANGGRASFYTPFVPPALTSGQSGGAIPAKISQDDLRFIASLIDSKIKNIKVSAVDMATTQDTLNSIETESKW